jgi:hypothetical protein
MTVVEDQLYRNPNLDTAVVCEDSFNLDSINLGDAIRGKFHLLCQDVSETIIGAVEKYESDKAFIEEEYGEGAYGGGAAISLARFDRRSRNDRKLDAALRVFFASTSEDDNVQVHPYTKELPNDSTVQTLVDITVPSDDYAISIVRLLEDLIYDENGSIVPNISSYRMIIEPVPQTAN